METINNLTAAASKAIWGETNTNGNETGGTEPLSGETGDVKAGEPYDKGNLATATTDTITSDKPLNEISGNTLASTLPIRSEHETSMENPSDAPTSSTSVAGPDVSSTTQKDQEPISSESQKIAETKQETEDVAKVDTTGPGPKPLDEVTKNGVAGGEDDGLQKEEEKGIHHQQPSGVTATPSKDGEESSNGGAKEKMKNFKDKLKAKLHRDKE